MKKKYLHSACFIAVILILSSCMPDFDEPENSNSKVGFLEASNAANKTLVSNTAGPQTIYGPVINLTSSSTATSEIHVQLAVDNSVVTAYNTANGTNYVTPAANLYSISGLTVNIAPGQSTGQLAIIIPDASLLSYTTTYALGFKIVSVDGGYRIDESLRTVPILINLVNQYDGVYILDGSIYRAGNIPPFTHVGPMEVNLQTTGAFSVRMMENHTFGSNQQIAATVSNPTFIINPANNLVTIVSDGGVFPAGLMNDPNYVSRYIPATKTFYVSSIWSNLTDRRMTDTIRFVRRRL